MGPEDYPMAGSIKGIDNNIPVMGQNCCGELPQREYMQSMNQRQKRVYLNQPVHLEEDIPEGLQTVGVPMLNI